MKELTRAEEQVMHLIWKQGKTTVKAVLAELPEPKPAVNTVSTIVRILERKGFVSHEAVGRGYLYFALVEKDVYAKNFMTNFVGNYFGNSFKELVSFFARENKLDINDFEEMLNEVKEDIEPK